MRDAPTQPTAPARKGKKARRTPGSTSPNQEAFDSDDDAAIVDHVEQTTQPNGRKQWKGCKRKLFGGRAGITDETVRLRYEQIKRNERYGVTAAARRLDARESDAAHELRRLDAHLRFAELTDPKAMAQLDTCAICERAVFRYEIYKSAMAAFSAAADKERGGAPSTFTVEQLLEFLDADPSPATVAEALGEPVSARRRGIRGCGRLNARRGKRDLTIPAAVDGCFRIAARGEKPPRQSESRQPQARTSRPWARASTGCSGCRSTRP